MMMFQPIQVKSNNMIASLGGTLFIQQMWVWINLKVYSTNCSNRYNVNKIKADRYYLNQKIRISKEKVEILKGMNKNYLTSTKDFDNRFLSRLLLCVFEENELIEGCVRVEGASGRDLKYKELDPIKFEFVKCKFREKKYFFDSKLHVIPNK